MLNAKLIMTSYFHIGAKIFFWKFCQLSRASEFHLYVKTGIYHLYPITYQNIKTELKMSFHSEETALQSYIGFYICLS